MKPRPRLRQLLRRTLILFSAAGLAAALAGTALNAAFPFPAERVVESRRGGSALISDRRGGLIAWRVDRSEAWRLPVHIGKVSPWMIKATVAAEDKRFFSHPGADPLAAARALVQNLASRRRVSGASTITMQAVRLLCPRPRTYAAKAVETFRAAQLERLAAKREVLELYFNLAPYGGNIVGIEAAARRYFGKSAAELSLGEAALLAGVPQRPAAFNPARHLPAALKRREFVFARLAELNLASPAELAAARREEIALAPRERATDAERFADWMVARLGGEPGAVRTTLDPETQAAVRSTLAAHAGRLGGMGIDGLAAVVIDVKSSELLAMVGSVKRGDPLVGQVNAATAPRQPGSLLKPFIYARAFDAGVLVPDSTVYDVPSSWRGYRPENFDRSFRGPMSARRALRESRNVPAVRLLSRLEPESLAGDMTRLGMPVRSAVERCGLSLALGSTEVKLVDVANAYAALARLGRWRPLRALDGEAGGESRQVYSPGAAYLALRCLGAAEPGGAPRPAWKTGTSWNFRDAWAVAVTPSRVAAVWCGKLSGRGHPALVGARAALPVALELIIELSREENWPRPDAVRLRRACALSGAPAGPACPCSVEAEHLPGKSSDLPCAIHRAAGGGRVVEVWPAEAAAWLAARGKAPKEARPAGRGRLAITSPLAGGEYVISGGEGPADVLYLTAQPPPGAAAVYWFLDGRLLGKSRAGARLAWPMRAGRHELLAADGRGASAKVCFTVLASGARPAP